MLLLALHTPLDWSFISIQFFVLNLAAVNLVYCPANVLFFYIPLLYYYTNLNSSIICCLFSGDIYLSFGVSISFSSVFWMKYFWNVLGRLWNTCYFISYFIANYITSCFCSFSSCSFWSSFHCICSRCFSTIKMVFWLHFILMLLATLVACVSTSLGSIVYLIFIMDILFKY